MRARRIVPRWRILDDVAATAWTDAIDMTDAQVASPATARTGGTGHIAADPRPRRRRTLPPGGAAPCPPTSPPCPSPSSPPPSTPTRSS
ncbi:MAG: hypothetical protein JO287_08150 [Pseudonocardiales bacterium]|nr:hypothetical protein [Pseudonocardiales bacterium]